MAEDRLPGTSEDHPEASTPSDSVGATPVAGERLAETSADKIAKALELKEEGNVAFKAGDYKKAIKKYHHVLMYTRAVTSPGDLQSMIPGIDPLVKKFHATEEEKAVATELAVTISNNLAVCFLKTNNWEKVVVYSNKVLAAQPDNAKALFRRGVANMNLNKTEDAERDLRRAQEISPEDSGIKKQLRLLEQKMKQHEKTEQKLYSAMFEN